MTGEISLFYDAVLLDPHHRKIPNNNQSQVICLTDMLLSMCYTNNNTVCGDHFHIWKLATWTQVFHTTKSTRFICLVSFVRLTGRYKIWSETAPLSTWPRPRFPIIWDNVGYFMATRGRGRTINCITSSELQPLSDDLGLVWAIFLHIQTIFFVSLTFTLSHKTSLNFRWGWARRFEGFLWALVRKLWTYIIVS